MIRALPRWLSCALLATFAVACADEAGSSGAAPDSGAPPDTAPPQDAGPDTTPASIDTMAPARVRAGEEVTVRCTALNAAGQPVELPAGMRPEVRYEPAMAVRRDGERTVASRVGTVQVRCALGALVDATPASMEIVVGAPARVTTTLNRGSITAGESATATCAVTDAEGNPISDARATVATMPTGEGVMVSGMTVSATRAGSYAVACQVSGATGDPATLTVSPALPASLRIARVPDRPVYAVSDEIEIETVVQDRYGNRIAMPPVSYASAPMGGTEVRAGRFRYDAEGRYTVTVQVTGPTEMGRTLRETTSFVVDSSGPTIACDGDATMVNLAPGAALPVRGTLRDTSGVRSVRVGGTEVQLGADGSFRGTVPSRWGMNFVEVRAVDTLGQENTRTCTFLVSDRWNPESGLLDDGVTLQLTQAGLDDNDPVTPITSVGDILQTVLNSPGLSQQLHSALLASNPLYDDCVLRILTCLARERVDYRDRELNGPNTTTLTLVDGGLRAQVRLENVGIRLRVDGTIDTDAWVRFRSLDVAVTFDVSSSGGMPRASVRAGSVSVTVGTVSVQIVGSGIATNILNALVGVVTSLANGVIRDQVSRLVRDYVQNNFNMVLNDVLRGLNVSSLGASFDVPRLDGMGTTSLGFGLGISSLNATSARLLAGIGTRLSVSRMARATPSLGVALPPRGTAEPTRRTPATVILQPGVLNQALHALWRGGFFDARIGGGMAMGMGTGGLPAGTTIDVQAALPPVGSLRSDGRVNLDLGGLTGSLSFPSLSSTPFRVALGARASAAVALVGNDLRFSDVRLDETYVNLDGVSMSAMENETLRAALQMLLQGLVDRSLNDALPAIPIPGFRIPESLRTYGLPVGRELGITSPTLAVEQGVFVLRGGFGVR